jgi:hypothetical protein
MALPLDLQEVRLKINSSELNLTAYTNVVSHRSANGSTIVIVTMPREQWFTYVTLDLTVTSAKKFELKAAYLGTRCPDNCWLKGLCLDGVCLSVLNLCVALIDQQTNDLS